MVMKKTFLLISLFFAVSASAQNSNYKVVFDMTSKDTMTQQSLVRQLNLIREMNPSSELEVVLYAQSLGLVLKNGTTQESAIVKLLADKNVSFKVCEAAMKRQNIDPSRLLPGVQTVPDGIYEIITKQREGWGYIKASL
jgi:intracellular sulfur oxidation DsrE/DsrF family protein